MVRSILNDTINYKENKALEKVDMVEHDAPLYHIEMYGVTLKIAIGKINKTYDDVYYAPIYIIFRNKVKMQIGVYEFAKDDLDELTDEDSDIAIEKLTPLLYSFVTSTPAILKKFRVEDDGGDDDGDDDGSGETKDEDGDPTKMDEGIVKESKDQWIKEYMEDERYRLIDNLPNGNCFFLAMVKSLKTKDIHTTVKDLRAQLADEITQEHYVNYKTRYDDFKKEGLALVSKGSALRENKSKYEAAAKKHKKDRDKVNQILSKYKDEQLKYKQIQQELKVVKEHLMEVNFMENVSNLQEMKEKVKTKEYYADELSISIMERLLNVKIIILSGDYYEEGNAGNVIMCLVPDEILSKAGKFLPDNYVIFENKGNHYKSIFIEDQGAFTYDELDDKLKTKLIDKCLQNKNSSLYLIPEFKEIYDKTAKHSPEAAAAASEEESGNVDVDIESSKHYDDKVVFIFNGTILGNKKLPGKGADEEIPPENEGDYFELGKINNWRRKLSNDYVGEDGYFEYDGKKWASVTHLYEGTKFKTNNPESYAQFSLDSESEVSKKISKAKTMGKDKSTQRPSSVTVDAGFYEENPKEGYSKIIEAGQMAKFSNPEFKNLLLATKNAKLVHQGIPTKGNIVYHELMNVREKLKKM